MARGSRAPSSAPSGENKEHPDGYYGHHRNRFRTDLVNKYRNIAKPEPPSIFLKRLHEKPEEHPFTMHDNKQRFSNDASYFGKGMGKRKVGGNNKKFESHDEVFRWREKEQDECPSLSFYQVSYGVDPSLKPLYTYTQGSASRPSRSIYANDYEELDKRIARNSFRYGGAGVSSTGRGNLHRTTDRFRKQKMLFMNRSDNVASCMKWSLKAGASDWDSKPRDPRYEKRLDEAVQKQTGKAEISDYGIQDNKVADGNAVDDPIRTDPSRAWQAHGQTARSVWTINPDTAPVLATAEAGTGTSFDLEQVHTATAGTATGVGIVTQSTLPKLDPAQQLVGTWTPGAEDSNRTI